MQFKNRKACLATNKMLGILLLIFSCFLLIGCLPKESVEDPGKNDSTKDKEAILSVIEKEFNGPDEKYRELRRAVTEGQKVNMNQEEYDAFLETPVYKEFNTYMKDTYALFFTENGYDIFTNATPAFLYSVFEGDYKLSTSDIEIKPSENDPTSYTFTFKVEFQNNNEISHYSFEGQAIVPEEGKIGKIEFIDKDGLQEKLNELNFEEMTT